DRGTTVTLYYGRGRGVLQEIGRANVQRYAVSVVGTSRCDVPARVQRAERIPQRQRTAVDVAPLYAARKAQRAVPTTLNASFGHSRGPGFQRLKSAKRSRTSASTSAGSSSVRAISFIRRSRYRTRNRETSVRTDPSLMPKRAATGT